MSKIHPIPKPFNQTTSTHLTPTGHLTALASPDALVDWRLALAWQALVDQGVIAQLPIADGDFETTLGVDSHSATTLLTLVSQWGLVQRDAHNIWRLGPVELRPEESEALAQHDTWIRRPAVGVQPRLKDRSAEIVGSSGQQKPPGATINFDTLAHASASNIIPVVNTCLRLNPATRRVLDLGGGHGWYAHEFAQRGLDVTLQDLPPVIEALRNTERGANIQLHAGNALESVAPGPFDLILCCTVTNMFGPEDNRRLICNAARQLGPDGVLVIATYMRDRNAVGAVFGVQMLVSTDHGDAYGSGEYQHWLRQARLKVSELIEVEDTGLSIIAAKND